MSASAVNVIDFVHVDKPTYVDPLVGVIPG